MNWSMFRFLPSGTMYKHAVATQNSKSCYKNVNLQQFLIAAHYYFILVSMQSPFPPE